MIRRFASASGRTLVPSKRCCCRHRAESPRSMPCAASPCFWIMGADGAAKALAEMLSGKGTITCGRLS
jgi:hypothetical protein